MVQISGQHGEPTIHARPVRPEAVVGPIRRRFRASQIIWYALGLVEALLFFRLVLRFIGANQGAAFTRFIYSASLPFAQPFMNVVAPGISGNVVFEWSTLLAMAVYSLAAWAIVKILVMSKPVSDAEADTKLASEE